MNERTSAIAAELVARYGPRLTAYVQMQARLTPRRLQRAITTAERTLSNHKIRLDAYAEAAYTQIDWSRVEGFKKELLELQD